MADEIPVRDRASTLRNTPAVAVPQGQYALLTIVSGVVTTHTLPDNGAVSIGRARECDVQVVDASVSRIHARLQIGEKVTITDLASANGTRVRGTAISPNEAVQVPVGEAIEIGGAMVLVQHQAASTRQWRIWAHGYFEGRVEDECARSSRANGTFGLLRLLPEAGAPTDVVQQVLSGILRDDDVVGLYGPGQYEVLLVDRTSSEADRIKLRLKSALGDVGVAVQIGLACFPEQGKIADRLAQYAAENARGQTADEARPGSIVIRSEPMRRLVDLVERVAPGGISVLILGETGVGKEIMAEEVHRQSPRRDKPFLRLNCAALSDTLLESELFGHERGAFTGATHTKAGLLETAQGGTVFLDEIGELPMPVQVKLLRVLEERKVWRVGGIKPRDIDVRFVAATNVNLEDAISARTFRQDLFFRLNGVALHIPPLRERVEEIEPMALEFIAQVAKAQNCRTMPRLTDAGLELLREYTWPGNVRELRNAIERAVLLAGNTDIAPEHFAVEKMTATVSTPRSRPPLKQLERWAVAAAADDDTGETMIPPPQNTAQDTSPNLGNTGPMVPLYAPDLAPADRMRQQVQEVERQHIVDALARCAGNQTRAARELGISRRTLITRLETYNIPRPLKNKN